MYGPEMCPLLNQEIDICCQITTFLRAPIPLIFHAQGYPKSSFLFPASSTSMPVLPKPSGLTSYYWQDIRCVPSVVYFDQLLDAACTQKLVETFFQPFFNLFCSFQSFFSDFPAEINKKHLKMNKKKLDFVYSSKMVDMQKLVDSLRGYPEIVFIGCCFTFFNIFQHISNDFSFCNVLTSFWMPAAPKSWLKYTTTKVVHAFI